MQKDVDARDKRGRDSADVEANNVLLTPKEKREAK